MNIVKIRDQNIKTMAPILLVFMILSAGCELSSDRLCGEYHWSDKGPNALEANLILNRDNTFEYRMGNDVAVAASTGKWRYLGVFHIELLCKDFSDTLVIVNSGNIEIVDKIYFKEGHALKKIVH